MALSLNVFNPTLSALRDMTPYEIIYLRVLEHIKSPSTLGIDPGIISAHRRNFW